MDNLSQMAITSLLVTSAVMLTPGCQRISPKADGNSPGHWSNQGASASGFVTSSNPVDLGTLLPGRPANVTLTIKNVGSASRTLNSVETSCPCIRVNSPPQSIGVGETVTLKILFDPSEEPNFRGGLAVELRALDPAGAQLFHTTVLVEVSDDASPRKGAGPGSPSP
jgi:Protein of unknown function (DUF1573)